MILMIPVLIVVGVFLLVYAFLSVLRPASATRGRQAMGCGFILLAGLVWGLALNVYLDGYGFSLGFGVAFLVSALATLFTPGRGGAGRALIPLVLGVLLCASALPSVMKRVRPTDSAEWERKLDSTFVELKEQLTKTSNYVTSLRNERADLKERLKQAGKKSFEEVASDPVAYGLLKELGEVSELLQVAEKREANLRNSSARVEGALRRMKRLAQAEDVLDLEISPREIDKIVEESRRPLEPTGSETVERHMEAAQLRSLFESSLE